jgi:hypothetical protein
MSDATDDRIRAVLLDAARLLEENGWCQHDFQKCTPKGTRYCLVGAVNEVVNGIEMPSFEARCEFRDHVTEAVKAAVGTKALFHWNDASGRTQAEVVAALRGAAEGLGKEGGE